MSSGRSGAGPVHHPVAPTVRTSFGISGRPFGRFHSHGFRRPGAFFESPFLYPDYYPEYYDEYQNEPAPAPPQPAPAMQVSQQPLGPPALLELQGNQWVKVSSFTMQPVSQAQAPATAKETPAVLVYRDGHREELTNYTIIGSIIHTRSDYWSNGAWSRSIQIADLDLPATFKLNQERGVKFELPSGPNEVVIRP